MQQTVLSYQICKTEMIVTLFKNCLISFQNLPELPNQFLEKAIVEIDFFQQKTIVPFKLYQNSPLVAMASVMSI